MARMQSTRVTVTVLLGAALVAATTACAAGADPVSFADAGLSPPGSTPPGGASAGGGFTSAGGNGVANGGTAGSPVSNGGGVGAGGAAAGGFVGNGGTMGNGGTVGNGGTIGTGGAAACTDTPPPNGDTCAHAVLYQWCGAPWMNGACARSCRACSGGAGGASPGGTGNAGGQNTGGAPSTGGAQATGGVTGAGGLPPIQGGQNGWASRYWDCCKPACGWTGNVPGGKAMSSCDVNNQSLGANYDAQNGCQGGPAYMCWNGAPWSVSSSVSYGFAAASAGNYACGRCYRLEFSGSGHSGTNAGATSLNGKNMIVQVINNGGVGGDQFDLLIPGGGVGDFPAGCTNQWGTSDLGSQYGGFLAGCNGDKTCVQQKCNSVFANKPDLLAGCNWFLGWFNAADNPNLVFKQVACPAEITQRSGLPDPG